MELYGSRLQEMRVEHGTYTDLDAASDFGRYLHGVNTDHMLELNYPERRRVHNLKYFTWVEQQGKTYEEIQYQWYERNYWTDIQQQVAEIDELITKFNWDAM
jgi:cysteine synthase A